MKRGKVADEGNKCEKGVTPGFQELLNKKFTGNKYFKHSRFRINYGVYFQELRGIPHMAKNKNRYDNLVFPLLLISLSVFKNLSLANKTGQFQWGIIANSTEIHRKNLKMKQTNILIIEDDAIVSRTIERTLRSSENRIRVASSGVEGLKAARWEIPDIVILDIVLPGMDGITVCKEFRADTLLADVPVLFLTARISFEDKIAGLSAGADDYLCKPFNVDELLLRIEAILRRARAQKKQKYSQWMSETPSKTEPVKKTDSNSLSVGPFKLYTRTYHFDGPGIEKIRLTPVQYDILYHLMSHPGEVFSPNRLLDEIWDYPTDAGSADLVRVHIKNIRNKVEKDPHHPTFLKTVSGFGYTIDPFDYHEPTQNTYGTSFAH